MNWLIDPVEEQSGILSGGTSLRDAAPLVIVPGFFRADIRKNGEGVTGRFRRPGVYFFGQDDRVWGSGFLVLLEERTVFGEEPFTRAPLQDKINKSLYFAPLVRREPGDFLVK
jgi:hypothetical protein